MFGFDTTVYVSDVLTLVQLFVSMVLFLKLYNKIPQFHPHIPELPTVKYHIYPHWSGHVPAETNPSIENLDV
jgi:hypothetical protein